MAREGRLSFSHFDPAARSLTDAFTLRAQFAEIEPRLFRFPAIDAGDFRRRLEEALE